MTRKRNRQRKIKSAAPDEHAFPSDSVTVDPAADVGKVGSEEVSIDSGNESPPICTSDDWKDHLIKHHKAESIRAWTFYQACLLERYHWFLEKKRNSVAKEFAERMSAACTHLPHDLLPIKMRELQGKMQKELEDVAIEENTANARFRDNVRRLENDESMESLPLIDEHVTTDQLERFVSRYSGSEIARTNEAVRKPTLQIKYDMTASFTGSLDSTDSGCIASPGRTRLLSDPSPRRTRLLSDIWKPDEDELTGSFTSTDFYGDSSNANKQPLIPNVLTSASHPDLPTSVGDAAIDSIEHFLAFPTAAETTQSPPNTEVLPKATNPHSIEDDDPGIQAVVYMKDKPTLDETHVNLQQPDSVLLDQSSYQNSFFGLHTLAQLSSEYSDGFNGDSIASDVMQTPSTAFPLSQVVDPLHPNMEVHIDDEAPAAPSQIATDGTDQAANGCLGEKPNMPAEERAEKKERPTEAVKFTDKKTIDVKQQQLVSAIKFSWSMDPDNKEDIAKEESETHTEPTKPAPSKPLSFASVLSKSTGPQGAITKTTDAVKQQDEVLFSTKKANRKFPKTSSLNKTSICWTYEKLKKCPWGDDCIFAHGKKELKPIPKWFKESGQSELMIKCKGEDAPHGEPCNDHFCYWRRQYLLRKTTICKLWQSGRCSATIEECPYAHGKADMLPLPKYEICRKFMNGKCNLQASECVYAHSKKELRKKPGMTTNDPVHKLLSSNRRLRTISETVVSSPCVEWSVVAKRGRVRTISGTSNNSCDSLPCDLEEFDWVAWNSQQDVPANAQLDDEWDSEECAICAEDFTAVNPRYLLNCKHDNFHVQCITRWVNEKDPSCPICRCSATYLEDEQYGEPYYDTSFYYE